MKEENKKKGNVPNLRFPEFTGEWEESTLESFIDIISGIPIQSEDILEEELGIRILRGINITEGVIRHNKEIDRYYAKPITDKIQKFVLEEKDLVLGMDGSKVGKNVALISKPDVGSILIQRVARIKALKNADIDFIFQKIYSNKFQRYVDVVNTSSGIPHISLQQIKDFETCFPVTLSEQTKIASFLSLIDKRIATQNKIIEKLESLIKGLSNLLYSQNIRFRDKNGCEFPLWQIKSLEVIGKTFNGLSGKTKEDFGTGKPYIQYKQVFDSPKIQIQNCGLVDISKNESQNRVKFGDVFFTVSSETPDEIGMSSVLLDDVDEVYLNSFCFGYRPFSFEILSPLFASYLFRNSSFRKKIVKIAQGSTRYNISKEKLMKIEISLPNVDEQIIITSFLSAIDEKIKLEKEILKLYTKQKNYLLQNLFI